MAIRPYKIYIKLSETAQRQSETIVGDCYLLETDDLLHVLILEIIVQKRHATLAFFNIGNIDPDVRAVRFPFGKQAHFCLALAERAERDVVDDTGLAVKEQDGVAIIGHWPAVASRKPDDDVKFQPPLHVFRLRGSEIVIHENVLRIKPLF